MRRYGYLGILTLIISEIFLFSGVGVVGRWFYLAAWWSYILIADAVVAKRSGSSLIFDRTREFIFMCLWSVFLWLVFEWFNQFLKNWHYINVTSSKPVRYLGYFLSYATVIPGILLTYELIKVKVKAKVTPLKEPEKLLIPLFTLGFVTFILPIAYPKYFFPLVWGTVIFILEPLNYIIGADSILRDWKRGDMSRFLGLLLSGLICGLLWEFWNYWAYTKWIYTVPFVGRPKLFEMPVLGFLGFPPFAVECWCFYNFVKRLFFGRPGLELSSIVLLQLPFYFYVFSIIDRFTVLCFI